MIYITWDSNLGTFFWRFHKTNFVGSSIENTYLIIVSDTGLCFSECYEAYYKLAWFEEQPYTTLIVPGKAGPYVVDCAVAEREWHGGKATFLRSSVLGLQNGLIYEIDGMRFLVLYEGTSKTQDMLKNLEVDFILAASISDINHIGDKVKFKHCYIGTGDEIVPDDELYTALDEQITVIKTV